MEQYAGIDVSFESASVCLVDASGLPPPTEAQARTLPIWHLLPTFYDQARVLVDEARSASASQTPFRTALLYEDTAQGRDAADGAQSQLDAMVAPADLEIMVDPEHVPAVEIAERIHDAGLTWVLFFSITRQIEQLAWALAVLPQQGRPR